jgi:tetratricopeptide (TPR) repeat protein
LSNLGNTLHKLGQYEKAKGCFERALAIEESVYEKNHPALATTLNNLGNTFGDLKQYEEAERCFDRSLFIIGEHMTILVTMNSLLKIMDKAKKP